MAGASAGACRRLKLFRYEAPIVGFHQDEVEHWVADLVCGHSQHVRHQPPWQNRQWVVSEQGRFEKTGFELDCVECDAENQDVID